MRHLPKIVLGLGSAVLLGHAIDVFSFRLSVPPSSTCLGCVALAIEKLLMLVIFAVLFALAVVYALTRRGQSVFTRGIRAAAWYSALLLVSVTSLQVVYVYALQSPRSDDVIPPRLHSLVSLVR